MTDQTGPADIAAVRSIGGKKCPICGKPAVSETRPFCSRRCADVDLSRWLGGAYRIPVDPATSEDEVDGHPLDTDPEKGGQ